MTGNRRLFMLILLMGIAPACRVPDRKMLVDHGASAHRIVIDPKATETDRKAAEELRHYLEVISSVRVPIVTDAAFEGEKYPVGGPRALTDGLRGTEDFHCNWLGFEGCAMEAVIDLGEDRPIRSISTDFVQDLMVWIFLPHEVEFLTSVDGKQYDSLETVSRKNDERRKGAFIETFKSEISIPEARYVKVKTKNYTHCPGWHKGANGLSWIFIDEIVVN